MKFTNWNEKGLIRQTKSLQSLYVSYKGLPNVRELCTRPVKRKSIFFQVSNVFNEI